MQEAGDKLGECLLFFGNRHRDRDYLYRFVNVHLLR